MLEIRGVSKSFDGMVVLDGISLSIEAGDVLALLGPSGSGKTTLLRIIAGLETADQGKVILDGKSLENMAVHERHFGMVFQDYALFPHKNVGQNVAFGLRMQRWRAEEAMARVQSLLALVGLEGFAERPVHELSGGEQQRVALARALAPEPAVLLLDEPLGALDHALRERLLGELRTILRGAQALGSGDSAITAVYVTHDQAEAFAVADCVALLHEGKVEQMASPVAIYRKPATPFVARFLGMENLFPGRFVGGSPPRFECELGILVLAEDSGPAEGSVEGDETILLVRPDAARVVSDGEEVANRIRGEIKAISFRGRYQEVTVTLSSGASLFLEFDPGVLLPDVGEMVDLALDPRALVMVGAGSD